MTPTLRWILLGIVGAMVGVTAIWESVSHFDLDVWGFLSVTVLLPVPLLGGLYYTYIRKDDRIAAMLLGFAFLIVFSPCCSVLTYFFFDPSAPRGDEALAALDRAMGLDWPGLMRWAAGHPRFNLFLLVVYRLSVFQILFIVAFLGWRGDPEDIGKLCLSIAICGIATILLWAPWQSFGAIAVYGLPPNVASKLTLIVDTHYTRNFLAGLNHGVGRISPTAIKGIVGFPSFHAAEAVVGTWFMRRQKYLSVFFLVFNLLCLLSTPIQGGHHFADVWGGVLVAAAAITLASFIADAAAARDGRARNFDRRAFS